MTVCDRPLVRDEGTVDMWLRQWMGMRVGREGLWDGRHVTKAVVCWWA